MSSSGDRILGHLDVAALSRRALAAGLPDAVAHRVAEIVWASGLTEDRQREVLEEFISHFEDGLAAGRSPHDLLAEFDSGPVAAGMLHRRKRVVTPVEAGGTGRRESTLRSWARDVRYATRRLRARPLFTLLALLSLALGIGVNAAMFTLVNEVLFRRSPVRAPEQLVEVYEDNEYSVGGYGVFSYPDLEDFIRGTGEVFSDVVGMNISYVPVDQTDGVAVSMAELVTPNYFEALGVSTQAGRPIRPEDAPGPDLGSVVVLADGYWRRAYGADPSVVGSTIHLGGRAYTILGVAAPQYQGYFRGIVTDMYVPITMTGALSGGGSQLTNRGSHGVFVRARLRPGATIEQARVAANAVAQELVGARIGGWRGEDGFMMLPTSQVILFPPVDAVLTPVALMLLVMAGLVLVITCANLAGFLLARAVDRRKDVAVRLALGATRRRLVGQMVLESLLLSLVGGIAGVLLGRLALQAVLATRLPIPVPITLGLPLDGRVIAFSIGVVLVAGILFGLAPALHGTRPDLAAVIRDESAGAGSGQRRGRLRRLLVASQIAMSVVLLVTGGLFLRSFAAASRTDPGFGHEPTGMLSVLLSRTQGDSALIRLYGRLTEEIAGSPLIASVGIMSNVHLNPVNTVTADVRVEGIAPPPDRDAYAVDAASIDTGLVAAAGLDLIAGRNFEATDRGGSPPVVLVNQAFVDRFLPGGSPLGRTVSVGSDTNATVVGVVRTARIRGLGEAPRPFVYRALAQRPDGVAWILGRTRPGGDAEEAARAMLAAVRRVDPSLFVIDVRTMERHLAQQALPLRLGAAAVGGFAMLALIMASIGLYGTVSYSVAQRTREVGIRLSLGAGREDVVRLLFRQGFRLVLSGLAIGLGIALLGSQLLRGLLFGVPAVDPVTFGAVAIGLLLVAGAAAYVPARRAGGVEPATALRVEG